MPGGIPFGFDRADGATYFPDDIEGGVQVLAGTPTPAGAVLVQTQSGGSALEDVQLEELPDSPEIERAEQCTVTKRFTGAWGDLQNRLQILGRRTIAQDSYGNFYRVLSATVRHRKPGYGELDVVSEAISFDTPPDEFQVIPVELGLNIMKHPRYFYAFLGAGYGSTTELQNQMVIRLLQDYFENTTAAYRDALINLLMDSLSHDNGQGTQPPAYNAKRGDFSGLVSGTDLAKRAACEIIMKYWRGEETPYVVGWQITWSIFFWKPPWINPGGYIEDPILDGQLPSYFWSPTSPWVEPSTDETIFSLIAAVNPQCYSVTGKPDGALVISWLRKADQVEYQRTWFKQTRTWIGAPVGHWDVDLYTNANRPQVPDDYRLVTTPDVFPL